MKKITVFLLGLMSVIEVLSQSTVGCSDTSYVRYLQFDIWAWQQADSNNRLATYNFLTLPRSNSAPRNQDILQYNYTDNPNGVKIVGLSVWEIGQPSYSTPGIQNLYLYDAQPDEFRLLAQVSWDPNDSTYIQDFPVTEYYPYVCQTKHNPLHYQSSGYNFYFDSAFVVRDSFYVGCSTNDLNYRYGIFRSGFFRQTDCDIPPIQWIIHNNSTTSYTFQYPTDKWVYTNSDQFLMVLPIIEVIDSDYVPPCEAVRDLSVQGIGTDTVVVNWTDDSRFEKYTVHYCLGNFGIGNTGRVDTVYTNQWIYAGPDYPNEQISVYVCGVCNDCDSVREGTKSEYKYFIWTPQQQTSVSDDDEVADNVYLTPNPAKGVVTVTSSFRINSIEVYTPQGRRLVEQPVGSVSTSIDVSTWPRGVYVVRLHTDGGNVSKHLMVD